MSDEFAVSKDTMEKVINYLATKPWVEVNPMISELYQCGLVGQKTEPLKVVPGPESDEEEPVSG